jgi:hypothetical protein
MPDLVWHDWGAVDIWVNLWMSPEIVPFKLMRGTSRYERLQVHSQIWRRRTARRRTQRIQNPE